MTGPGQRMVMSHAGMVCYGRVQEIGSVASGDRGAVYAEVARQSCRADGPEANEFG